MNQKQIAQLILDTISKERFRQWHNEGGRFDRYITGEEKPDEQDILSDIVDLFNIPKDKETEVPVAYQPTAQTAEYNPNVNIDEICDTGIVLEDGRQLTFADIGEILHQLARSFGDLPNTKKLYSNVECIRAFNRAGDILKEMNEKHD